MWWKEDRNGPRDPEDFGVYVRAFIGPEEIVEGDSFDFVVCTPRWLLSNFRHPSLGRGAYESDNLLFGRQIVLMERWSEGELRQAIEQLCADCRAPDWGTAANRLSRWLPWEFYYQYDEHLDKVGGVPGFQET